MLTTWLHCTHVDAIHYTNTPAVGPWCMYTSALSRVERSPQHHTPHQVGPRPRWPFQDFSAPNCLQGNKPVNELLVVWMSLHSEFLPWYSFHLDLSFFLEQKKGNCCYRRNVLSSQPSFDLQHMMSSKHGWTLGISCKSKICMLIPR